MHNRNFVFRRIEQTAFCSSPIIVFYSITARLSKRGTFSNLRIKTSQIRTMAGGSMPLPRDLTIFCSLTMKKNVNKILSGNGRSTANALRESVGIPRQTPRCEPSTSSTGSSDKRSIRISAGTGKSPGFFVPIFQDSMTFRNILSGNRISR